MKSSWSGLRRKLKVNANKSKVVLLVKGNLECRIWLDGEKLERTQSFELVGGVFCDDE